MSAGRLITPIVNRWIEDGLRDPEGFWARAAEQLPWFRRWDRVFEWTPPTFRWFIGAETNLAWNAVDHHVAHGRGGHAALVYLNERGDRSVFTYAQLLFEVKRLAAALRGLGLRKGDRITIYMPTSVEAIMLMLATVRIGAIHSVVFAGFGANALGDRIAASGSRLVFTSDVTYRKGKSVALKSIVDDALKVGGASVEHVIVWERKRPAEAGRYEDAGEGARNVRLPPDGKYEDAGEGARNVRLRPDGKYEDAGEGARSVRLQPDGNGREISWTQFVALGEGHSSDVERMEANEPAWILATSGTTAKPKLAVHTHGGYQVHIVSMARWCFGMTPADVWWATSDIGWIVGHSYMVYAPLLIGCTSVVFEGALDHPQPEANWRAVVEEFGATGIFTSPTAVRMLMRYGDEPLQRVDHSRLERVVCAGEVLNAPAWDWLQNRILKNRAPVIDHMWQTETGGPAFGNPYGIDLLPIKPGSATIALPGIDAAVVTMDGEPCGPNEKGVMTIRRPFPGLTPALWGEPGRYGRDYWQKIPDVYYCGDSAHVDEDGYVWFGGRADEIIKIAGHRIGTIEVESAFLKHSSVAECGVIGRPDDTRGEVVSAFVLLKHGHAASDELRRALVETVRRELGPVAVIGELNFVSMLPKTRSGKIMRRVLRAVILDRDPGDITTIEDEGSVEEARQAWQQMRTDVRQA